MLLLENMFFNTHVLWNLWSDVFFNSYNKTSTKMARTRMRNAPKNINLKIIQSIQSKYIWYNNIQYIGVLEKPKIQQEKNFTLKKYIRTDEFFEFLQKYIINYETESPIDCWLPGVLSFNKLNFLLPPLLLYYSLFLLFFKVWFLV